MSSSSAVVTRNEIEATVDTWIAQMTKGKKIDAPKIRKFKIEPRAEGIGLGASEDYKKYKTLVEDPLQKKLKNRLEKEQRLRQEKELEIGGGIKRLREESKDDMKGKSTQASKKQKTITAKTIPIAIPPNSLGNSGQTEGKKKRKRKKKKRREEEANNEGKTGNGTAEVDSD